MHADGEGRERRPTQRCPLQGHVRKANQAIRSIHPLQNEGEESPL